MTVIIFHIFWLYHIALFVKEISFLWQIMNVSMQTSLLSIHCIAVKSALVFTRTS